MSSWRSKYSVVCRFLKERRKYIDGLVQDCSNSIANALELLQSCTKPSIYAFANITTPAHGLLPSDAIHIYRTDNWEAHILYLSIKLYCVKMSLQNREYWWGFYLISSNLKVDSIITTRDQHGLEVNRQWSLNALILWDMFPNEIIEIHNLKQ